MYTYLGKIKRVIDGDTVDIMLDLGFGHYQATRLRVRGIDAPEIRGPERPDGLESKQQLEQQLPVGHNVLVRSHKRGKYGRYSADIYYRPGQPDASAAQIRAEPTNLSAYLVRSGLAIADEAAGYPTTAVAACTAECFLNQVS